MFKGFVLVWFVSFQDSKWWVYSFCYCWLLGNVLLKGTCVYLGMCMHVSYKIMWTKYRFVFSFFLRSWSPATPPPPAPARFQGRCKKSLLSVFKRSAGGNSKGLRCQYHRYCVYLEQTVLQLQRSARSTVLAFEPSWEEEEKGEIFLSFFLFSFLFKGKCSAESFHCGPWFVYSELPVSLFKCWLGFFPLLLIPEWGRLLFLLCLSLKRRVWGENNISDSSRINPKCLDQKQLSKVRLFWALARRVLQATH